MSPATDRPTPVGRRARARQIAIGGTVARLLVGSVLLGSVILGQASSGWHPLSWVLGLLLAPALLIAAAHVRARRTPDRLNATGPAFHLLTVAGFLALYLAPTFTPAPRPLSDATLIFYGFSMLLAAARGYAGCELLAIPNWLTGRDDQLGCLLFAPIDRLEQRNNARRNLLNCTLPKLIEEKADDPDRGVSLRSGGSVPASWMPPSACRPLATRWW